MRERIFNRARGAVVWAAANQPDWRTHGRPRLLSKTVVIFPQANEHLLGGISLTTQIRLERAGKLRVVRPTGKSKGQVFHPAEDVHALAGIQSEGDADA